MKKFILLLSSVLAVSGCVAAWGQAYKVEFASSSSITINFDPSFANMGEIQNVAQQHCDKYQKDAVPQGDAMSPWGMVNMSFRCIKRE